MKIAAVVTLYHPKAEVLQNILSYYDFVEKIYVFDNSETSSTVQDDLVKLSKVVFFQSFTNEGVANRLNEGCNLAKKNEADWVLTMDQDSYFGEASINTYLSCANSYAGKEKVAIFGTSFGRKEEQSKGGCQSTPAEKLITSGSLVNLDVFEKVNGFDDNLFIDSVDYDYCFRCLKAGYLLIKFTNISLSHCVGSEVHRSSIKSLFYLKKQRKSIHRSGVTTCIETCFI